MLLWDCSACCTGSGQAVVLGRQPPCQGHCLSPPHSLLGSVGPEAECHQAPLEQAQSALTLLHHAGSYPESHRGGGSRRSQKKRFHGIPPQHRAVGIPLRLPAWLCVPSRLQKQGEIKCPQGSCCWADLAALSPLWPHSPLAPRLPYSTRITGNQSRAQGRI